MTRRSGKARSSLEPGRLLLIDLGFVNQALFDALSREGLFFVTRAKSNAALTEWNR